MLFFFFKQKTAYEVRISDWSSDVCSSDLVAAIKQSSDGKAVVNEMKKLPTDDPLFGKGIIRADGRKVHDMYLFEVKKPSESKYPWDYYRVQKTIPAVDVWRPLSEGGCPFIPS